MKLTRHQADLVLRHYTAEYAERANREASFNTLPDLYTFHRGLQWRIDADLGRSQLDCLVEAWLGWLAGHTPASFWESEINVRANDILDAAGFRGPHILRYSEQETTV